MNGNVGEEEPDYPEDDAGDQALEFTGASQEDAEPATGDANGADITEETGKDEDQVQHEETGPATQNGDAQKGAKASQKVTNQAASFSLQPPNWLYYQILTWLWGSMVVA